MEESNKFSGPGRLCVGVPTRRVCRGSEGSAQLRGKQSCGRPLRDRGANPVEIGGSTPGGMVEGGGGVDGGRLGCRYRRKRDL